MAVSKQVTGSVNVGMLVRLFFLMAFLTTQIVTVNICGFYSETKLAMLRTFINRNLYDVVFLQEVAVETFNFYGYQEVINLNPQKRGTAVLVKEGFVLNSIVQLPDGRGIAFNIGDVVFVNIYAPSGAGNKRERSDFFAEHVTPLFRFYNGKVVFEGDFNCIIERNNAGSREICYSLLKIVSDMRLRDAWRIREQSDGFTFRAVNSASRIDRIYVSECFVKDVKAVKVIPIAFSDHCAMACHVNLNLDHVFMRKGFWKMNGNILNDERFLPAFRSKWADWQKVKQRFKDVAEWWENYVKKQIKWFARNFTAEMHREEYEMINFYQSCLRELAMKPSLGREDFIKYKAIKGKITKLHWKKLNGIYVRSKCSKRLPDDRTSMYHTVKKEKRRRTNLISSIKGVNGRVSETQEEIMQLFLENFTKEFARPVDVLTDNCDFLSDLERVISKEDNDAFVAPLTLQEITDALNMSANGKSPGSDGIIAEFYKTVWDVIGEDIKEILNTVLKRAKLCLTQSTGLVVMIPKVSRQIF